MELDRLIETERRNDALVAAARDQAAAIVRAAQDEVAERRATLAAAVDQLIRDSRVALDAERGRRIAELVASADAERRRFDSVTDARIADLVPDLVQLLLTDDGAR